MSDDFDDDWEDEPDETGTVECPQCGEEIYEEAPQCPHCGEYVVHTATRFWSNRPVWYILLALLGILATLVFLLVP